MEILPDLTERVTDTNRSAGNGYAIVAIHCDGVFMKEVNTHTYTGNCTSHTHVHTLLSIIPGHHRGSKEESALYDLTADGFSA